MVRSLDSLAHPLDKKARRNSNARKARRNAAILQAKLNRPFVAIDAEGESFGETWEHNGRRYRDHRTFLWGASNETGDAQWLEGDKLDTATILDWLCDLPAKFPDAIFVAFSFGYDVTQALCDLDFQTAWEVSKGRNYGTDKKPGQMRRIVFWREFGIRYLRGKQFTVYRLENPREPYITVKGERKLRYSSRIEIFDVFGFFQSSFIKAAVSFPGAIGDRELAIIKAGKANRATFKKENLKEIKEYTTCELVVLSRMMRLLRETLEHENLCLTRWFGAGSIAQALLKRENVYEHFWQVGTEEKTMEAYQVAAHYAYFGGRIELIKQGKTTRPLHGYDISSAYPAICATLPSMRGGRWLRRERSLDKDCLHSMSPLSLIKIRSRGRIDNAPFYPFPYRTPEGAILFPPEVFGWYMVEEVKAAFEYQEKLAGDSWQIEILEAWEFVVEETVKPFGFVPALFDFRASLPKSSILSIVIKLGINSVYGKLAQAVGTMGKAPRSANPWYAAAITAGTRATILRAALEAPDKIVMFATDGIISEQPLAALYCPAKKTLGAWESGLLRKGGIFVQSGVYSISDEHGNYSAKSRGFRPDNIGSSDKLGDYLMETIPPLWKADAPKMEFTYSFYQTLGSAVASEDAFAFIGMWGDGTRELDQRTSGGKRLVIESTRRRRASKLVASEPDWRNAFMRDENGELCISAPAMPDWLNREFGEARREEVETMEIFAARFGIEL